MSVQLDHRHRPPNEGEGVMTETTHTREPWKVSDHTSHVACIIAPGTPARPDGAGGRPRTVAYIGSVMRHLHSPVAREHTANARRIAAAVNACAHISTEDLEEMGVGGLATATRAGRATRAQTRIDLSDIEDALQRLYDDPDTCDGSTEGACPCPACVAHDAFDRVRARLESIDAPDTDRRAAD